MADHPSIHISSSEPANKTSRNRQSFISRFVDGSYVLVVVPNASDDAGNKSYLQRGPITSSDGTTFDGFFNPNYAGHSGVFDDLSNSSVKSVAFGRILGQRTDAAGNKLCVVAMSVGQYDTDESNFRTYHPNEKFRFGSLYYVTRGMHGMRLIDDSHVDIRDFVNESDAVNSIAEIYYKFQFANTLERLKYKPQPRTNLNVPSETIDMN